MSQEQTRFPIRPRDLHRTAMSSKDLAVLGEQRRRDRVGRGRAAPPVPPPSRPRRRPGTQPSQDAAAADEA